MSVTDFKKKVAQKYDTSVDNVIISYGDKEYRGTASNP
jgi:ribosomal protein S24E